MYCKYLILLQLCINRIIYVHCLEFKKNIPNLLTILHIFNIKQSHKICKFNEREMKVPKQVKLQIQKKSILKTCLLLITNLNFV